ncbi:toprim domain-containing protein [Gluconobacter thailandicus]|nr:toprim domain-containing protein [Gluconobacter thailandicus]
MARFEPFRLSDDDRTDIVKGVSCALLLERHGYLLDKPESTRHALKYRAGKGETIIVNHEGRGWWDTGSDEKGDVFSLIQRLTPGLKFRDACRELGQLVGIEPKGAEYVRERQAKMPDVAPAERWQARKELKSAIDALSYAALDSERTRETLYCSTAGGMGPETVEALTAELAEIAKDPASVLVAATDHDEAGNRYAARLAELGREAGVRVIRRIPHGGCKDFNDALKTVVAAARAA